MGLFLKEGGDETGRTGEEGARDSGRGERLVQVRAQVVEMLEAHRQAHEPIRDARAQPLLGGELLVRGARRVDDERARVTDVRQQAPQLHPIDELAPRIDAPLHPERDEPARALAQVLLRVGERGILLQPRVTHPLHAGMGAQPPRHRQRVLRVTLHAQLQRLQTEDEGMRIERAQRGPQVPQPLDARLGDEGRRAESLVQPQPVVAGVGLRELGEAAIVPGEGPPIHDDAANRRAMAADVLRRAVHHDVRPVAQRVEERRGQRRVVHDERNPRLAGDGSQGLEVRDVQARVANGLDVNRLRLRANGRADGARLVRVHEARVDAKARQRHLEEVVRAPVEAGGRDELISRLEDVHQRERLGRLARGDRQGPHAPFQGRDALLEDIRRGVGDARVDVAGLLQREEVRGMLRVAEAVAGRLVDGDGARTRGGVGLVASVEGQGLEVLRLLGRAHRVSPRGRGKSHEETGGQTRQSPPSLAGWVGSGHCATGRRKAVNRWRAEAHHTACTFDSWRRPRRSLRTARWSPSAILSSCPSKQRTSREAVRSGQLAFEGGPAGPHPLPHVLHLLLVGGEVLARVPAGEVGLANGSGRTKGLVGRGPLGPVPACGGGCLPHVAVDEGEHRLQLQLIAQQRPVARPHRLREGRLGEHPREEQVVLREGGPRRGARPGGVEVLAKARVQVPGDEAPGTAGGRIKGVIGILSLRIRPKDERVEDPPILVVIACQPLAEARAEGGGVRIRDKADEAGQGIEGVGPSLLGSPLLFLEALVQPCLGGAVLAKPGEVGVLVHRLEEIRVLGQTVGRHQALVDVVRHRVQPPVAVVHIEHGAEGADLHVGRVHAVPQIKGQPRAQVRVVIEGGDEHHALAVREAPAEHGLVEEVLVRELEGEAALGEDAGGGPAVLRLDGIRPAPVEDPHGAVLARGEAPLIVGQMHDREPILLGVGSGIDDGHVAGRVLVLRHAHLQRACLPRALFLEEEVPHRRLILAGRPAQRGARRVEGRPRWQVLHGEAQPLCGMAGATGHLHRERLSFEHPAGLARRGRTHRGQGRWPWVILPRRCSRLRRSPGGLLRRSGDRGGPLGFGGRLGASFRCGVRVRRRTPHHRQTQPPPQHTHQRTKSLQTPLPAPVSGHEE
ncbi:hypothetical protein STIAU_5996 [Stigmatella aurantiaca DW4/3-1]|uniref:Uncharacterized protein n=1 Tax=Stigmatella aurantiaca (strain DW4/3-1) TaxID=378806 RepID=Q09AD1_STIAD|nr:hypothetical protein STIAU_5996 [Stigmatella aurantiaca DW4/3-1]